MVRSVDTEKEHRDLVARLNAIMLLSVENMLASGLISKSRAIEILHSSGLSSVEIAEIFGIKATNIRMTILRMRKQKRTRSDKSVMH